MNRMTAATFALATFFVCATPSFAQVAPVPVRTAAFSPAKRELIKEFLDAIGGRQNAEQVIELMLTQSEQDMEKLLGSTQEGDDELPEEFRRELEASRARASKRFRELFRERINFGEIFEQIAFETYGNRFTEQELRDMIAFYKSVTGQKMVRETPQIFADSLRLTSERLLPRVVEIVNHVADEEKKRLEALETSPPPAARPASRRPARRARRSS